MLPGALTMSDGKLERILKSRQALRERFEARMRATPSMSDDAPLGSGPVNRHGMPKLPSGQTESKKWPVLDLGVQPSVSRETFRLTLDGAVHAPVSLDFAELLKLEQ